MREFITFIIIFAILSAILAGFIRLAGGSFGINFRDAWFLSLISLVFFAPGLVNIHIFANPKGEESKVGRIFALMRGLGMCLAGLMCVVPMFTVVKDPSNLFWGAGIGFAMLIISMPLEAFFEHINRNKR